MRNAGFLLQEARHPETGRLARTWRQGQRGPDGYLDDHAALGLSLLALYQADPDPKWFTAAEDLVEGMIDLFTDPDGGFFDTGRDAERLIVRPKDLQDNATPCGSSLAARLLLELAAFSGEGRYHDLAARTISPIQAGTRQYPTAFANWLCAMDFAAGPVREVAVVGPDSPGRGALLDVVSNAYRPRLVLAAGEIGEPPPALLADRTTLNGAPAAYVCQNFVCLQPVTDPAELDKQLALQ